MKDVRKELERLSSEIEEHQYLYYVKNQPKISDLEFDQLFSKLQKLESEYPELVSPNSPTRRVGSDLSNDFKKFNHKIPVLSLENTYSTQELIDWATKLDLDELYSLEWKVDGASIVLYYRNGSLEHAVTRGTGGVGDDITENIRTIKNIPLRIKEKSELIVRGEVYMTFTDFEEFNKENSGKYANPRNLVSGSIKQKHSYQVASRPLKIVVYDAFSPEIKKFSTHSDWMDFLKLMKFPVSEDMEFHKVSNFSKIIEKFRKKKEKLNFPTDGMVIKLNSMKRREILGNTTHSPRWARALKFDATLKETIILDIDFAIGRTGKITPRAKIEPVELLGTTVTYATLHNQDYINEKKIGIGARVLVAKRGEIIPAVEEVLEISKQGIFRLPDRCPTCSTKLIKIDESVDYFCTNTKCKARVLNSLIFFCQKKQMDIEGLGEKQITNFFETETIQSIPDIYDLHLKREELENREGLGKKSVDIILKGIEVSKNKDLRFLLPSLGFSEIGHRVTEFLRDAGYKNIDEIIQVAQSESGRDRFLSIHGLGERTVDSILSVFQNPIHLKLISDLKERGLKFSFDEINKSKEQIFSGQTWCITGSFDNFQPREKAVEIIKIYGGSVTTSVTNKTSVLLAGEKAGSKLDKAQKLNTKILNESEFLDLLKSFGIKWD